MDHFEEDYGAKITDEALSDLKSRIGIPLRVIARWNTEASRDTIRHWAWGIGDENPLWCDERYANNTRWGCIIAPPTFVQTCGSVKFDQGLPGVHALYAGETWDFYD